MAEKTIPNIFIELGLDPNKPWNQSEFERQLEAKRRDWARVSGIPSPKGIAAKKNLDAIPKMKRVAANEELRSAQAAAAVQQQAQKRAEQEQKLGEDIRVLEAKGEIYQEELDTLCESYKGVFEPAAVRARIKVPITKRAKSSRSQQPALETTLAKQISDQLELLGKKDLYDFLGMDENTSTRLLFKRSQELYDEKSKGLTDTQTTTAKQLSGHCMAIFKDDSSRARYEETRRQAGYKILTEMMNTAGKSNSRVEAPQLALILDEAKKRKLNIEEAMEILNEFAHQRKYTLIIPQELVEKARSLKRCGRCKHVNAVNLKHCSNCGDPLEVPCPQCKKEISTDQFACSHCGFPVGNRNLVMGYLAEIKLYCQEMNFEAADRIIKSAKDAWPVKDKNEPTARNIAEQEELIRKQLTAQRSALEKANQFLQEQQYYAARAYLPQIEKLFAPGDKCLKDLQLEINREIQKAEAKLTYAQEVAHKQGADKAVLIFQEVLMICSDCEEARAMLRQTPPSPPFGLKIVLIGKLVRLTWAASVSPQIKYTIVRKQEARPSSAEDGKMVAHTEALSFDDNSCAPGVSYFYAVFANRAGVFSKTPATHNDPVLLVADVEQLVARTGDRQVDLTWKPPQHAVDIIVRRDEQSYPLSTNGGAGVALLDQGHALDSEVKNSSTYFYTVFAIYKDIKGHLVASSGAQISAKPEPPPDVIKELRIKKDAVGGARRVILEWASPPSGQVVILKSIKPTKLRAGEQIARSQLSGYGEILPTYNSSLIDMVGENASIYYTPVILVSGSAFIGKEHRYVNVEDVTELHVSRLGYALRLTWRWPIGCKKALVLASVTGWPDPEQTSNCTEVTRGQYEISGYFDLNMQGHRDHFIIVQASYGAENEQLLAPGTRHLERISSRITLNYEIRISRFPRLRCSLEVTAQGKGTLPALLLVRKQGMLPLKSQDGDVILNTAPQQLNKEQNSISFPIDPGMLGKNNYCKLFLADDSLYGDIIIYHPNINKLRLSS